MLLANLGWDDTHLQGLNSLQDQLKESNRLAHRDPTMTLCILTDESEKHWAVAATQ